MIIGAILSSREKSEPTRLAWRHLCLCPRACSTQPAGARKLRASVQHRSGNLSGNLQGERPFGFRGRQAARGPYCVGSPSSQGESMSATASPTQSETAPHDEQSQRDGGTGDSVSETPRTSSLTSPRVLQPTRHSPIQMTQSGHSDGDATLPAGWMRETDKRSGRPFYVNHALKKWAWTPPGASSSAGSAASSRAHSPGAGVGMPEAADRSGGDGRARSPRRATCSTFGDVSGA